MLEIMNRRVDIPGIRKNGDLSGGNKVQKLLFVRIEVQRRYMGL